jgi:hypothetical protein
MPYNLFNAVLFYTYRHWLYCHYVNIKKVHAYGSREEFVGLGCWSFVLKSIFVSHVDSHKHPSPVHCDCKVSHRHPTNLLCIPVSLNVVSYARLYLLLWIWYLFAKCFILIVQMVVVGFLSSLWWGVSENNVCVVWTYLVIWEFCIK